MNAKHKNKANAAATSLFAAAFALADFTHLLCRLVLT